MDYAQRTVVCGALIIWRFSWQHLDCSRSAVNSCLTKSCRGPAILAAGPPLFKGGRQNRISPKSGRFVRLFFRSVCFWLNAFSVVERPPIVVVKLLICPCNSDHRVLVNVSLRATGENISEKVVTDRRATRRHHWASAYRECAPAELE